jgi:hypothetical protein
MPPPRGDPQGRGVVDPSIQRPIPASTPPDPDAVLRERFGYPGFRPGQRELVDAALAGRDAVGILPTGGGKTICYQVPALLLPGLAVVVSPLVSLMEDQLRRARTAGLAAAAFHSGLPAEERARVEAGLLRGTIRLLLLAPERLESRRFRALLPRLDVALLTVDEAHCISMWGHDFRPAYRAIGGLRATLRSPVLALTATATPRVRRDIEEALRMRRPFRYVGSFDRPNLLWAVRSVKSVQEKASLIFRVLWSFPGARLVYASTRKRVESVRSELARRGLRAEAYHAGLPPRERARVQEYFLEDAAWSCTISSPAPSRTTTRRPDGRGETESRPFVWRSSPGRTPGSTAPSSIGPTPRCGARASGGGWWRREGCRGAWGSAATEGRSSGQSADMRRPERAVAGAFWSGSARGTCRGAAGGAIAASGGTGCSSELRVGKFFPFNVASSAVVGCRHGVAGRDGSVTELSSDAGS